MAPPYSTQLYNGSFVVPTGATLYTVPAGKLIVITDVTMQATFSLANQLQNVRIGACVIAFALAVGAGTVITHWSGKQVLNAGQTIVYGCSAPSSAVCITAYLLDV